MKLKELITQSLLRGFKTGFVLAAATNAAIMLASDKENNAPWAALNESWLGIGVNGTAMCAWGVIYEGALLVTKTRSNLLTALLGTTVAYFIDYKLVPPQFTPGIEKRVSHNAVLAAYAGIALGFALSPLWNKPPRPNSGEPE